AMLHAAASRGLGLDAFVVRKDAKAHGLQRRIEGPDVDCPDSVVRVQGKRPSSDWMWIFLDRGPSIRVRPERCGPVIPEMLRLARRMAFGTASRPGLFCAEDGDRGA
ncbi:MAG: hypothetical protein LBG11_11215, partial [Bifidobacteriaceae bacterium]|nr:hypothetical protein [Bifidobacteriaceae bacterium]